MPEVWTVTRVAHGFIVRGCCGNTDTICNCKPGECDCPPVTNTEEKE